MFREVTVSVPLPIRDGPAYIILQRKDVNSFTDKLAAPSNFLSCVFLSLVAADFWAVKLSVS